MNKHYVYVLAATLLIAPNAKGQGQSSTKNMSANSEKVQIAEEFAAVLRYQGHLKSEIARVSKNASDAAGMASDAARIFHLSLVDFQALSVVGESLSYS